MWRRYACVRQSDTTDCGPAALATIALHYRVAVNPQQLRDLTGTDRVGTTLAGMQRAAAHLGFQAKSVRATSDSLRWAPLPAIAHIRGEDGRGHFVVLYRIDRRSVLIADPAQGLRRLSHAAFAERWTGYLILITRPSSSERKGGDAGSHRPFARFVRLLVAQRGLLLESIGCGLLMTWLGLSTSYFVRLLVDSVLVRGEGRLLNALSLGMVLLLVFRSLFGVLRHLILAHLGRRVDLALMSHFSHHLLTLPLSYFEMRQVGEILSRVNDTTKIREAIGGTTLTAAVDGVMVIGTVVALWCYDGPLAAVATAFVPALVLVVIAHHPATKRASRQAMEASGRISSQLVENVYGIDTWKASCTESHRAERVDQQLVQLARSVFSLQVLGLSASSLGGLIQGTAGITVLWFGGHRVIEGALTLGELMFFYTLLVYLLEPLERLASVNLQFQDALVAMERLDQVLALETESSPRAAASFPELTRGIQWHKVSFGYGCRGPVVRDIDLVIPARSTVGIVGASGCGKSTLLKLLLRFYDPTDGRITIDGIDLRDLDLTELRRHVGWVSQDPFLFNGSIRDNLTLYRPDATWAEIIEVAERCGLAKFIDELPQRYATEIGERGTNLSGGQRQRLALARVILQAPSIVLFDEATSQLDSCTERAIQQQLGPFFAERTVMIVAHRLSTLRDADLIYVLDEGQIVERGTHAALLQQDGRYTELWRAQEGARDTRLSHVPEPLAFAGETSAHGYDLPTNQWNTKG